MPKHVLLESNFIVDAFPPPHIAGKYENDAQILWRRYIEGDVILHVPHMAFREAYTAILRKYFTIRFDSIREIHRVLTEQAVDLQLPLIEGGIDNFIQEANSYFQNEKRQAVKERINTAEKMVADNGGMILLDERVIEMLPLDIDHEMEFLDQVILACMLVRADDLIGQNASSEIYLCNANKHHFAPEYNDPKTMKLIETLNVALSGKTCNCLDLAINCLKPQIRPKLKKLYQERNITFLDHFFVP